MPNQCLLDLGLEAENLAILFQPILESHGQAWRLHSLECLTRGPRDTNLEPANVLFEYVRSNQIETEVDRVCVARALNRASEIDTQASFSLNVHAATLARDEEFAAFLADMADENAIPASRLIIEIVDHARFWGENGFVRSLAELHRLGFRLALDDISFEYSHVRNALESEPQFFKLDQFLVEGCYKDSQRRAIIESILTLARRLNARVIAEGVSTAADLQVIAGLGVNLVQGHVFYPAMTETELNETGVLSGRNVFPPGRC